MSLCTGCVSSNRNFSLSFLSLVFLRWFIYLFFSLFISMFRLFVSSLTGGLMLGLGLGNPKVYTHETKWLFNSGLVWLWLSLALPPAGKQSSRTTAISEMDGWDGIGLCNKMDFQLWLSLAFA